MTKYCPHCDTTKETTEFGVNNSKPDKLQSVCKPCKKAYGQRHYNANKKAYAESRARNVLKIRKLVSEIKEAAPCTDCRVSYPSYVMDFDHVTDDKVRNIAALVGEGYHTAVMAEIAKCELVCSNCHRIRTHQRRVDKRASAE